MDRRAPMRRGAQRLSRHVIIGLGSDLIDIRRIERTLERFGDRFIERVFTDVERAALGGPGRRAPAATPSASPPRRPAPRRSAPASAAASIWRDMGVVNLPSGKPTMTLTGGAAAPAGGNHPARHGRRRSTSP